jgi:hypothetical protein
MDEPIRHRSKPRKMRVIFPNGDIICYASVKETFLVTLRKIGGEKLGKVKMSVCHLPMFSQEIYPSYKDYMAPVGDGWYVNFQGDTYNKYLQLQEISRQLNLNLKIDLSEDFKGAHISRGEKSMCVLEVTFPDGTVVGEENTIDTFMQCIWHIGVDKVKRLGLMQGEKQLITSNNLYKGQIQIDVNSWLVVPNSLRDKVKILRVISVMNHINMRINAFSTGETQKYKKIGRKRQSKSETESTLPQKEKYKLGTSIYHSRHGQGLIIGIEHRGGATYYKIKFHIKPNSEGKPDRIIVLPEREIIKI